MKKFNWFDILIILVVAAACFVGYMFLSGDSDSNENGQNPKVTFVVEVKKMDDNYQDVIKKGDKIYQTPKGIYMGKVSDVRWESATEVVEAPETGEYIKTEVPGKYDYYITVTGTPKKYLKSYISFGDQPVRVGEELEFKSTKYAGNGYIVDIIENKGE